ncbi:MAG: hypothetical protein RL346_1526 [Verrucomicrobiota bacterium]|jgi:hypothetical protein
MKSAFFCLALSISLHAGGLKFEDALQEAEASLETTEVTREFPFTNQESKPIRIRNADAGCTCVAVEFLKSQSTYAAGESGVMRVTFKIQNFQGTVDKKVLIWLDGDPDDQPSSFATLRIHIPTAVKLEPKTLNWMLGSPTDTKIMRVTFHPDQAASVINTTSSSENFSTEIVTVEKGKIYDIRVTPKTTNTPALCILGIETDFKIETFRKQQGFARIVNPATAP